MIGVTVGGIMFILNVNIPIEYLTDPRLYLGLLWTILFFLGGYIFYGSLYAACGAMSDKDNENQTYMTIITFLLLGSFYIGEYAVTNPESPMVIFCSFFPFTSPTIAAVNAIAGNIPVWQSLLTLFVLYFFAYCTVSIAGKIYTSSLLLKGRKFTPKDIFLFIKSK